MHTLKSPINWFVKLNFGGIILASVVVLLPQMNAYLLIYPQRGHRHHLEPEQKHCRNKDELGRKICMVLTLGSKAYDYDWTVWGWSIFIDNPNMLLLPHVLLDGITSCYVMFAWTLPCVVRCVTKAKPPGGTVSIWRISGWPSSSMWYRIVS